MWIDCGPKIAYCCRLRPRSLVKIRGLTWTPSVVGIMSSSKSWGVNRHVRENGPISVVSLCKLVSG